MGDLTEKDLAEADCPRFSNSVLSQPTPRKMARQQGKRASRRKGACLTMQTTHKTLQDTVQCFTMPPSMVATTGSHDCRINTNLTTGLKGNRFKWTAFVIFGTLIFLGANVTRVYFTTQVSRSDTVLWNSYGRKPGGAGTR